MIGCVFIEAEMRATAMVIAEVRRQKAAQVRGVQNDQVIEALATNGPDQPLDKRVLPGTDGTGYDFANRHAHDASLEHVAVNAVSVAQQPPWSSIVGKRVDDLLRRPFGRGVLGHVEVNDAAPFVRQHQEYEQDPSGHGRNGEEIHRGSRRDVIREEGSPRL